MFIDSSGLAPLEGQGASSPGKTGSSMSGPYKAPTTIASRIGNSVLSTAARQALSALTGLPASAFKKTPWGLALFPKGMGCGSFDCNNDGIIDKEFRDLLEDMDGMSKSMDACK